MEVRLAICNYMVNIAHVLLGRHINECFTIVQDYIRLKRMDCNGT